MHTILRAGARELATSFGVGPPRGCFGFGVEGSIVPGGNPAIASEVPMFPVGVLGLRFGTDSIGLDRRRAVRWVG